MLLFWAIFNPSDLQYHIVLWLVSITVSYFKSIILAFHYSTTIMNSVAIANFFHKTYRGNFNYLFRVRSSNSGLFGTVSAYFGIVETNGRGILYFYCLVWLKRMSSSFNLHKRIVDEDGFKTWLLSSLDQVIRCKLTPVDTNQVLLEVKLSVLAINNTSVFALQLKDDANLIASRVQIHSWTHNATYFKYGYNKTKCQFKFL